MSSDYNSFPLQSSVNYISCIAGIDPLNLNPKTGNTQIILHLQTGISSQARFISPKFRYLTSSIYRGLQSPCGLAGCIHTSILTVPGSVPRQWHLRSVTLSYRVVLGRAVGSQHSPTLSTATLFRKAKAPQHSPGTCYDVIYGLTVRNRNLQFAI